MIIYNYDHSGRYVGQGNADPDPLQPGQYLIPANATGVQPPDTEYGFYPKWDGVSWIIVQEPDSGPSLEQREADARFLRDQKLRYYYDPGVMMCLRGLRMTEDPQQISYIEGKLEELDLYAIALQEVPEQTGFPDNIIWPEAPTP